MEKRKEKENNIANKQRIAELEKQKKMMEQELDDLNGRTGSKNIAKYAIK